MGTALKLLLLTLAAALFQEPAPVPKPSPALPQAATQEGGRMPNHLIHESSPYLLQHAYNPVDWYPWGEEAHARSRQEDKPIFLSIGYSSCHWCHVMEKESFEDPEIAAFLNEHFVAIKVDREERPDLDEFYMAFVQRATGGGGWPMTVFLTPDLKPFYGGTYFPPRSRHGRPGLIDLLHGIADAWENRRADIEKSAEQVVGELSVALPPAPDTGLPAAVKLRELEKEWVQGFSTSFDEENGGFGGAPKFPHAEDLRWLLAAGQRSGLEKAGRMALRSLRAMAKGGVYDQIGGGFHRYATDAAWHVPHFEKMLYDQGTLVPAYLEAWRQTGDPFFARIVRETCDYLLREMRDPGGAFWSATDADSEGVEGKFFVWTPKQIREVLGPERGHFAALVLGATPHGNFEGGTTVLYRARTPEQAAKEASLKDADPDRLFEELRAQLLAARAKRVPPATDDKIIAGWNGLAISALSMAGRMLDEPRYTAAAAQAADFLVTHLAGEDGWKRTWRKGQSRGGAVLEDYAYLCRGFLDLLQSTGEERWLAEAEKAAGILVRDFWDPQSGVFWNTDGKDGTVLKRMQAPWDGATPAPNAVALESLVRLYAFTGDARWQKIADAGFAAAFALATRSPQAFSATLRPLWWAVQEPRVAVVLGTGSRESLSGWRKALYAPHVPALFCVFRPQAAPQSPAGLFTDRPEHDGKATLYLCEGTHCLPPSTEPAGLAELLAR